MVGENFGADMQSVLPMSDTEFIDCDGAPIRTMYYYGWLLVYSLSTGGEYDEKPLRDRDQDRDRRTDFSEGGDRERERRPQERDREREGGRRPAGPPVNAWSKGKPRSLGGSGPDRDTPRVILKRVEEPQAPVSGDVRVDPSHHKNELCNLK